MSNNNKPEDQRDRLQLKDQKDHAGSNVNDSTNRAQSGMPDTRGMGLKEIGGVILLLVILVIAYGLYQMFFG
ncbi:hypothetical protein AUC31_14695 [Planococcus rifietoensis]|uniref:Phage capsid protein n=1 Tax=Planococcus rifietoensis TaxID=200991 RepID=A0A0U2XHL0_9BACL|nr:DUF6366 family protein [Planococcus rifietoensis]ALS76367.1 hypothetical protein AUC31_14695 [Planococcus rifietoensis]